MVAKCLFLCVLRPSHPHKNPYAALRSTLFSFRQSLHLFSFLWTNVLIIKPHFCTRAMEYKNVGYRMQRCPVHSICYCCSVTKSCLTLCDPMDCNTPGFPVIHYLPKLAQTHIHWVGDAIQQSHPVAPFFFCLQSFWASGSFLEMANKLKKRCSTPFAIRET